MSLGQWIAQRAVRQPQRPFLLAPDAVCNNRDFDARVNRAAHFLLGRGIGKGQRVAVLLGNHSPFLEVFFACAKIGAVLVPLNHSLTQVELGYMIQDCRPQLLIHGPKFATVVHQLAALTGFPIQTICIHHRWPEAAADLQWGGENSDQTPGLPQEIADEDALIIVYTSGTTGDPKGAVLTHGNFLYGALQSVHNYQLDDGFRSLVVAPLYHIGALAASVTPVVYAGGALMLSAFDHPSKVLDQIVTQRINYMFAVPVMFEMMSQSAAWADTDLSQVHFFITGGAPMPPDLIRLYQEQKNIRFAQGYGMTETLRITALDLADATRKIGSVGKETRHTRLRIVDPAGQVVPNGTVGEITVQGPTVFKHYWNRLAETEARFRDGWFYTGDLGYRDTEGFLYMRGRKTDMIITAGKNVYAAEVERALAQLPQVARAAVVGIPDPRRGEAVVAFVSLIRPDTRFDELELRQALNGRIADYKIPRQFIFVDELPLTPTGKILKHRLLADMALRTP